MLKMFFQFFEKFIGKSGAMFLTGAGLSVASYAAIATAATTALNGATNAFGGLGGELAAIVYMCGVGQAVSIIGAAMLTKAAIQSASLGIMKKPQ